MNKQEEKKFVVKRARRGAGFGLFAKKPFKRSDFIIEYRGPIISTEEADDNGGKYLFTVNKKEVVNGFLHSNTARYINHSCKPNAYTEIDGKKIMIYAKRQIEVGDELTYDYGKEYFDDLIKPHGCKCDACTLKGGAEKNTKRKKPTR